MKKRYEHGPHLDTFDLIAEEWSKVPDFPYSVSNMGRIRRDEHYVHTTSGKVNHYQKKILSPSIKPFGLQVGLWHNRKRKMYLVKYLVAKAFVPNPNGHARVSLTDGNPRNCKAGNLEWK